MVRKETSGQKETDRYCSLYMARSTLPSSLRETQLIRGEGNRSDRKGKERKGEGKELG